MREYCTSGSVAGAPGHRSPYAGGIICRLFGSRIQVNCPRNWALKLAKALGAEVTLFTRSPGKESNARRLGAEYIVLSTEAAQMEAAKGRFDLIVDTVPYAHDVNPYLSTLTLDGTLVLVGLVGDLEPALSTVPLILGRKSVAGSVIGGIPETQELLDFCGAHGITSDIEIIKIQEINAAYERMLGCSGATSSTASSSTWRRCRRRSHDEITTAASRIEIQGTRYPEVLEKRTGSHRPVFDR